MKFVTVEEERKTEQAFLWKFLRLVVSFVGMENSHTSIIHTATHRSFTFTQVNYYYSSCIFTQEIR